MDKKTQSEIANKHKKQKIIISVIVVALLIITIVLLIVLPGKIRRSNIIKLVKDNPSIIENSFDGSEGKLIKQYYSGKYTVEKIEKIKYIDDYDVVFITIYLSNEYNAAEMSNTGRDLYRYSLDDAIEECAKVNGFEDVIFIKCHLSIIAGNEAYDVLSVPEDRNKHFANIIITDDEKGILWSGVQKEVKKKLKYPSSARFPTYSKASFSRSGDSYTVSGTCEAKNAFGVIGNVSFTVNFSKTGYNEFIAISTVVNES